MHTLFPLLFSPQYSLTLQIALFLIPSAALCPNRWTHHSSVSLSRPPSMGPCVCLPFFSLHTVQWAIWYLAFSTEVGLSLGLVTSGGFSGSQSHGLSSPLKKSDVMVLGLDQSAEKWQPLEISVFLSFMMGKAEHSLIRWWAFHFLFHLTVVSRLLFFYLRFYLFERVIVRERA